MKSVRKIVSLIMVLLAVVLVLGHNIFPHNHNEHQENCKGHISHVCSSAKEMHFDNCAEWHSELCSAYEFVSYNSQISHTIQVVEINYDAEPHVCECKSHFIVVVSHIFDDLCWQRDIPKRAPPFFA